jgi:hypothetical protein
LQGLSFTDSPGWRFLISGLDVKRDIAGMVIVRMLKIRKCRHAPLVVVPIGVSL